MTKVSLEHANTFSFQDPFTYSDSRMCLGPCFETEKLVSVVQFSFSDFSFLRTRACVGLLVRVSRRKRDRTGVVRFSLGVSRREWWSSFPADFAKPVPLAVVSLDSR